MSDGARYELVMATIAVVFKGNVSTFSIDQQFVTSLLRPPLSVGGTPDGQTLIASQRDQLDISLASNRLNVRELSGDLGDGATKIPPVLDALLHHYTELGLQPTSYGVNATLDVLVDDPRRWILENLVRDNLGASGARHVTLTVDHAPKLWNLQFDARDDRVNVDLNAHQDVTEPMSAAGTGDELIGQIKDLEEYLVQIGLLEG